MICTVYMQIDRARTNLNFDFCWNIIRPSLASPPAVVTRTIQGLVYIASIRYVNIILKYYIFSTKSCIFPVWFKIYLTEKETSRASKISAHQNKSIEVCDFKQHFLFQVFDDRFKNKPSDKPETLMAPPTPAAVTPLAPPPPQRELRPHPPPPPPPIKVDDSDSDSDTITRDKNDWYQRLLQVRHFESNLQFLSII